MSIYRHNTVVNLGTLTDDHIPVPEIYTTALDEETMLGSAYVSESTTIIDTVYYSGLKPGMLYTLSPIHWLHGMMHSIWGAVHIPVMFTK